MKFIQRETLASVIMRILRRVEKKKKSSITPLEFRDQTVACWVSAWRNHICYVCPEKRSPNELVDFQKSAPPSSRTVYPNEQEIKQRLQEVCMDKQGTPHKIRHKKATYKKRKQCHVTRRNKETLAEHTTMGLIKVKLTCSWMWWRAWKATRKVSTSMSAAKERQGKIWTHFWMGQGTCWQIIWRRLRYSMPFLLQS